MAIAMFNEAWYAEFLSQHHNIDTPQAILTGFCVLAQSIDHLAKVIEEKDIVKE